MLFTRWGNELRYIRRIAEEQRRRQGYIGRGKLLQGTDGVLEGFPLIKHGVDADSFRKDYLVEAGMSKSQIISKPNQDNLILSYLAEDMRDLDEQGHWLPQRR